MTGYQRFQEDWERDAKRERESFDALPVTELIERIRTGHYGEYYTIWYALARKALPAEAGWLLFDILNSNEDYLIRYHCAGALISIGQDALHGWEPVMLSAERFPLRENLEKVESVLKELLGDRSP